MDTDTNRSSWHSAVSTTGEAVLANLDSEIIDVCTDDCDAGTLWISFRVRNVGGVDVGSGVSVAVYAATGTGDVLVGQTEIAQDIDSGWASASVELGLDAALAAGAESLWVSVDDDGTGGGSLQECQELDNRVMIEGPFCE